jgi:hypothetical protein
MQFLWLEDAYNLDQFIAEHVWNLSFWVWLLKPVHLLLHQNQTTELLSCRRPAILVSSVSACGSFVVPLDNLGSQSFKD